MEKYDKKIAENMIVTAFEGGSNYWYRIESDTSGNYLKQAFSSKGLVISNYGIQDEDEPKVKTLNTISLEKGMVIFKEKYLKTHYVDALGENGDATTGDVFLQCCLFGSVIYG